jgi:hypothetical protein
MTSSRLVELFEDAGLIEKIQRKLPYLFHLAEQESARGGRVGMEVGSKREQILVALLIYKFGEENVNTSVPITMPEVDVLLYNEPVFIKTITGLGGVKVVWTVDWEKVEEFRRSYEPRSDILLAQIRWGSDGGLFLIPRELQRDVFHDLGRDRYLHIPKRGTNPRGVEIARKALRRMLSDETGRLRKIDIRWERPDVAPIEPYRRWLDYWRSDSA